MIFRLTDSLIYYSWVINILRLFKKETLLFNPYLEEEEEVKSCLSQDDLYVNEYHELHRILNSVI